MWDIIGDIHGEAEKLQALLVKMDYVNKGNKQMPLYQHKTRRACFLGDYIDRGINIVDTLNIVKNMCEHSSAQAILGNHELNFLAYHTIVKNPSNAANSQQENKEEYLRPHTEKNTLEVQNTLDEFAALGDGGEIFKKWFFSLPYYLDLGPIRLIHAYWDSKEIKILKESNYFKKKPGFLTAENVSYLNYLDAENKALERLLKGRGYTLPKSLSFKDDTGIPRKNIRLQWWKNPMKTLSQLRHLLIHKNQNITANNNLDKLSSAEYQQVIALLNDIFFLPSRDTEKFLSQFIPLLSEDILDLLPSKFSEYTNSMKPLFIGHYWLRMRNTPKPLLTNMACLDYSSVRGGHLCAYRYDNEPFLSSKNFVWV